MDQRKQWKSGPNNHKFGNQRFRGTNRRVGNGTEISSSTLAKKYGYKRLDEFVSKGCENEIVIYICNNFVEFKELLKSKPRWDILVLLLKVVKKILNTDFSENKLKILSSLCDNEFREHLSASIVNTAVEKLNNTETFFDCLIVIFEAVINLLPFTAADCFNKLIVLICLILKEKPDLKLIYEKALSLQNNLNILITKKNEEKAKNPQPVDKWSHLEPPNDYRSISIFPMKEDFQERNFLRPNIVVGSYENAYHYLDIQFRLLREDFIQPLRIGFQIYRENLEKPKANRVKNHYVKIYNNVKFMKLDVDLKNNSKGISYQVELDKGFYKKIKWDYSKRLLYGSLLLFSANNFSTFFLATVSDRSVKDLSEKGVFKVSLKNDLINKSINFEAFYTLMESSAFFDPYFNVLSTLQKLSVESLPMENYFLVKDNTPNTPNYMKHMTLRIGNFLEDNLYSVSIGDPCQWPSAMDLCLNESQYEAFRASLENEFVVVQGPPGTGKTFLGLKIVKTLLKNYDNLNLDSPIVIVCYTNHALDQFLENLIDTTEAIIRIGGQSKNEQLKKFNISTMRTFKASPSFYEAKDELSKMLEIIHTTTSLIDALQNNSSLKEGVLDIQFFLNKEKSLKRLFNLDGDFEYWLLEEFFINHDIQYDDYQHYGSLCGGITQKAVFVQEINDLDSDDENYQRLVNEEDSMFKDVNLKALEVQYIVDYYTLDKIRKKLLGDLLNPDLTPHEERHLEHLVSNFNDLGKYLIRMAKNLPNVSNITHLLNRNPWSLSYPDRWKIYLYLNKQLITHFNDNMTLYITKYSHLMQNFEEERCKLDYNFLKTAKPKILGLTTTGAARHHTLLELLKPKIVVVEEAAEVLEAHVTISLTRHCEHVILIGDHEQLRPNPACMNLAKKFMLDVSLFERMLMNGMNCYQLNVQHRMREEIVSLITPTIYKELRSHPSVLSYPQIRGVTKNMFFIDHKVFESEDPDSDSHKNPHEGDFVMALCRYLLLQNYSPNEITVLTTYSAQQFYLREKKKKHGIFREVRVTVVDNYQGEENNIIIISLVRSNKEGNVGFLKIRNRICVAMSRAKHGFYIIGNMSNLCDASDIWKEINNTLKNEDAIGDSLELRCEIHKTLTPVKSASDFVNVQEGGCMLKCERLMPCGHHCLRLCHMVDIDHLEAKCFQPCQRPICIEGHPCPLKCFEKCNPCYVKVNKSLPCGHMTEDFCHILPERINCMVTINDTKPDCLHPVDRLCYLTINQVICPVPCNTRLDCGHACVKNCHVNNDPDHEEYLCLKECELDNKLCQEKHKCQKRCHEECGLCVVKVKRKLSCDHLVEMDCSVLIEDVKCPRRCKKILACGHPCKLDCYKPCGGCKERVNKIMEDCGHTIKNAICGEPLIKKMCRGPCQKVLPCGHICPLKCGADCTLAECRVLVSCPVKQACGHEASVPCFTAKSFNDGRSDLLLKYCQKPCSQTLPCGDLCQGTCGSCMQGRIHHACKSPCKNTLVCGHECKVPCRDNCPPCQMKCRYKCIHSVCRKQCGVPCKPCKERCVWNCDHLKCTQRCGDLCDRKPCYEPCKKKLKCGHLCVGFCGEPCPYLCRVCDYEKLTEILFGDEEEPDSRFVLLADCNHILESHGLEKWMGEETIDKNRPKEIKVKCCPKCKTPIITTLRFMNQTKISFQQIEAVKKKIYNISKNPQDLIKEIKPRIAEVMALLKSNTYIDPFDSKIEQVLNNIIKFRNQKIPKCSTNEILMTTFITETMYNLLKDCENGARKKITYKWDVIVTRLNLLIYHLSKRENRISKMEIDQFNNESLRFHQMVNCFFLLGGIGSLNANVANIIEEVESALLSIDSYCIIKDKFITERLRELKRYLGPIYQTVSDEERRMVNKAMYSAFSSGHWFECSQGHIYTITECGGAVSQGTCPECKEVIGGTRYNLVKTSRPSIKMNSSMKTTKNVGPLKFAHF